MDHSSLADAELMARMAAGDETALGTLYDRHGDVVYGAVLRFLGDRQAAEEVVQDAFLAIWREARRYDAGTGSAAGWLLRIARNRAIDRLRAAARRPLVMDLAGLTTGVATDGGTERAMASGGQPVGTVEPGPEDLITRRWSQAVVRTALSAMPELERRALELAYDEDLTQVEIGMRLGWPLGTVKSRTRRALATLRTVLEGVPGLLDERTDLASAQAGRHRGSSFPGGADAAR
jgi:RNA polymerase sigma-70 factor (ECF subfamily)